MMICGDHLYPQPPPTGSATDILSEKDVTVSNVRLAPSTVLLRCRARNVRARYVRLRTAYDGHKIQPFVFTLDDMEGTESAHVRVTKLLSYIEAHDLEIAKLERDMPYKPGAATRMKKANRGGGSMQRMLKLKDDAVLVEITRRKRTNELVPPDNEDNTERSDGDNGEDNTPRTLYPAAFKDDVDRINREIDMEESGVKKLSVNDKWAIARANALAKGDMGIVNSLDNAKANRQAANKRKRGRRKAKKADLKEYKRKMGY